MKRRMTQIIALVIALLTLIPAAGCTGKKDTASTGTTVEQSSTETTVPVKTPVTLKIYSAQGLPAQFPSGVQTDEVSKEIERVTGVTLDWQDTQPNDDKTKVIIASGDFPDIFMNNSVTLADSIVKGGGIMEIEALVESNGPNIKRVASKAIEYSKKYLSGDTGKLYFVPGRISGQDVYYSPVIGLFMRWDYYKELGCPEIKTVDDLVNVVAAMQEKHPVTEDGQKVFGFSPWHDWGLWNYSVMHDDIFGFAGAPGCGSGVCGWDRKNMAFVDRLNDDASSIWIDAQIYNKAYRKGLLDPETFTQKYDQAVAKMDAGRVLCQVAQWVTDKINAEFQTKGKTDAGYVNIPWTGASYHASNCNPVGLASYWAISAKCKNPDRAMDVIDYFYSVEGSRTILSGIKGKHWIEENGKATLTEEGRKVKDNPNFMTTTGIHKFQNMTGIDMMAKDTNGQFLDLFLEPEVVAALLTPVKKNWLSYYGVNSEDELWRKYDGFAENTAFGGLFPQTPDDIKRVDGKIDSYLRSNMPKVWMAESDAEFDKQKARIREDIKKMQDYDKLVEFYKKAVEDTKAAVEAYN